MYKRVQTTNEKSYIKRLQTSNEKVVKSKTVYIIGMPQKGLKQVSETQRKAPTSLVHFVEFHNKVK